MTSEDRLETLKRVAGGGAPEERVHNLAVYYFGGPPRDRGGMGWSDE